MKIRKNLQFYVDKLKAGEKFSLARYGDGELLCMWGKQGGNSNGCAYTPELRAALLQSMKVTDQDFIHGLQRVELWDQDRIISEYPAIEWHDSEIFGEAAASGGLAPFIEEINKHPVTVIGNYSIREATAKLFPHRWFIEVPPVNAFQVEAEVVGKILWEDRFTKEPKVYLFSCGMAANALVASLHGKVQGWLLDVGHIWDPFAGSMSRCDLQ